MELCPEPCIYDQDDKNAIESIMDISKNSGKFLLNTETDKALKNILKFSNFFNQYFQKKQPWKNKDTSSTTLSFQLMQ